MKNKIGKQVWFDGILWDVDKIFSPTKFDHYILVKRIRKGQIHEDRKTHPVDMMLIDSGNDQFYPNTKEVRGMMRVLNGGKIQITEIQEKLSHIWLDTVK